MAYPPKIKKENKGLFTKKAKAAGQSVQGYASKVLANKKHEPTKLIREAAFAKNFGGAAKKRGKRG